MNRQKNQRQRCSGCSKQAGFTLIEIIVVIAIFTLITATAMVSYSSTSANYGLEEVQAQLVGTIKDVRQKAMYGRELADTGEYPSYGVVIQKGKGYVKLYADCDTNMDDNGDGQLGVGDEFRPTPSECPSPPGAYLEKVELKNDVSIKRIYFDDNTYNTDPGEKVDKVYIEYIGSSQDIWITGMEGAMSRILFTGNITIILQTPRADLTRSVDVWSSGLIDSEKKGDQD